LQDYPGWLLEAQIVREFNNPAFDFSGHYTITAGPVPNIASTLLICIFALVAPIEVAGKLFLSLYMVLYPLSIIYLLRSTQHYEISIELVPIVYLMNWFFFKGMVNYLYGLSVMFFCIGLFLRNPNLSRSTALVLGALTIVTFFFHLAPYIILIFALASLTLLRFLRGEKPYTNLPCVALALAPSILLLAAYLILILNASHSKPVWGVSSKLVSLLVPFTPFFRYDPFGSNLPLTAINIFIPLAIVGFILLSLGERICGHDGDLSHHLSPAFPQSPRSIILYPDLAIVALAILLAALVAPTSAGHLSWIDQRFIYPSLALLAAALRWKRYQLGSDMAVGILAVLVIGLQWANWAWVSPKLENIHNLTTLSQSPLRILYTSEVCNMHPYNRLSAGILPAYRIPFYHDLLVGNFNEGVFDTGLLSQPQSPQGRRGTSYIHLDPLKPFDERLLSGYNSVQIITCNSQSAQNLMDQIAKGYHLVGRSEDVYLLQRQKLGK
jgi:hypothetical protein